MRSFYLKSIFTGIIMICQLQICFSEETAGSIRKTHRIISLAPNITEILYAIDAGDLLVGVTDYDHYPHDTIALPRLGGYLNPDLERIIQLQPTVSIMLSGKTRLENKLNDLGIETWVYRIESYDEIIASISDLGRRLDRITPSVRLASVIHNHTNRDRNIAIGNPGVMLVLGSNSSVLKSVFVACGDSFLTHIIQNMGFRNIFADINSSYMEVTLESIIERRPDIIIELAPDEGFKPGITAFDPGSSFRKWEALDRVPAVRDKNYILLRQDYLLIPGPRITQTMDALKKAMGRWIRNPD